MPFELVPAGTHINFLGQRKICLAISVGLILLGAVFALPSVKGVRVGLDFAGGTEVQVLFAPGVSVDGTRLREVARGAGFLDASVVRFGELDSSEYLIKFTDASGVAETDENPEGLAANTQVVQLEKAIRSQIGDFTEQRVEYVGPKVGSELREDGVKALFYSAIMILIYVAFRFSSRFAPGAVVAVVHDLTITAGLLVMMGEEFDLRILAAMLAILGYSLNDTIIIYDRIRENMELRTTADLEEVLNTSVNQTLSRTVLTSVTTLLAVLSLYFLGGEVIQPFAKTMVIGVLVGTYSSVFIASPLLLLLEERFGDDDRGSKDGKGAGVNKAASRTARV